MLKYVVVEDSLVMGEEAARSSVTSFLGCGISCCGLKKMVLVAALLERRLQLGVICYLFGSQARGEHGSSERDLTVG
jgi:hypothetical protein